MKRQSQQEATFDSWGDSASEAVEIKKLKELTKSLTENDYLKSLL